MIHDVRVSLKSVEELMTMRFFIPSYQRGYRWTNQQVEDLLNDVNDFEQIDTSWYCLQPLAIRKMDSNDERLQKQEIDANHPWYEVIDGQQRLTTIFITLKVLQKGDGVFPEIVYETRLGSGKFLTEIQHKEGKDAEYVDYYFMLQAKDTITKWAGDHPEKVSLLIEKLKARCRVIWYETNENAYEVFKRLNTGKIALSNAELTKALLLKGENFDDETVLKRLEMAAEWDNMEQILHDNSFWYFINPEPEASRFVCTRIDFLLEMVLRAGYFKNYNSDVVTEGQKINDYYIFTEASKIMRSSGWEKFWQNIQMCFRTMKAWYDDRQLYHYIGYLINCRGSAKLDTLCILLAESCKKGKKEFLEALREKCIDTLIAKKNECAFQDLKYGEKNNEIHNILLLFNLATTQNQTSEIARYPFDEHFRAAKRKWSLEHIHAQNEKTAKWTKDQLKIIVNHLQLLMNYGDSKGEGIEALLDYLQEHIKGESVDINPDVISKAVIGAFMGASVKKEVNESGEVSFDSTFDVDNHLTNMALLQGDKNAALNNKLFPEKRQILSNYENAETKTAFVPICTSRVFFKHYSPLSQNPFVWDKKAGLEYVTAIVKTVAAYIGLEPVLVYKDDSNEPESLINYGVRRKSKKVDASASNEEAPNVIQ